MLLRVLCFPPAHTQKRYLTLLLLLLLLGLSLLLLLLLLQVGQLG
jgi:hypothetical protein